MNKPLWGSIGGFLSSLSIINIKTSVKKSTFSFTEVESTDIEEELKGLDSKKSCISNSIPAKMLKENSSICGEPLKDIYNSSLRTYNYDKDLKYADLTPVHKKDDTTEKRNYRPISLLAAVSKNYAEANRCLYA